MSDNTWFAITLGLVAAFTVILITPIMAGAASVSTGEVEITR